MISCDFALRRIACLKGLGQKSEFFPPLGLQQLGYLSSWWWWCLSCFCPWPCQCSQCIRNSHRWESARSARCRMKREAQLTLAQLTQLIIWQGVLFWPFQIQFMCLSILAKLVVWRLKMRRRPLAFLRISPSSSLLTLLPGHLLAGLGGNQIFYFV